MGQTLTDDEVVVLEDLDFEVPCQFKEGCQNPARWQLLCLQCKGSSLYCGPCRVQHDMAVSASLAALAHLGIALLQCAYCKGIAFRFPELFRWVPFEGRQS